MTKFINSFDASKLSIQSEIAKMEGHAVVQVTPELAKSWLKLHNDNRPLSMTKVKWYVNQMKAGEWKLSGQGLIFSDTGTGLDGQHRLKAISLSGCTIEIDVRFGISKDVFDVLDSGPARTAADSLAIEGIKNYNVVASMVRNIMEFDRYDKASYHSGDKRPTNAAILDYAIKNRELEDYANLANKYYKICAGILTSSTIGTVHYLASKVDKEKSDLFIYRLCTGADISPSDPIFKLRTVLMKAKMDKSRSLNRKVMYALIIKTWRLFLKGKSIKLLKFDQEREPYPSFYLD